MHFNKCLFYLYFKIQIQNIFWSLYNTDNLFSWSFNPGALILVTTVPLGETVTFTCFVPDMEYSNIRVKWYKQSTGDSLLLITTLLKATSKPTFEQGFSPSRFDANYTTTLSTLTILRTIQEDEAVYHCGRFTWSKDTWSGTYLSLKSKTYSISVLCGSMVNRKYLFFSWSLNTVFICTTILC